MRTKQKGFLPGYSWGMLALVLLANGVAYFGSRLVTRGLAHYSLISPLDRKLPFLPVFILFYLLAYVQWVVGFVWIAKGSRREVLRILTGELIAKGIALACFLLFPTTVEGFRPEAEALRGGGIWNELVGVVYSLDAADNCFPSVHCLESWVCFRGAMKCRRAKRWYVLMMFGVAILVFASTVLVKQHVLIDIAGGVAAVEIGFRIADRIPFADGAPSAGGEPE